ncbi:MAG: protein kinase [Deltaproteobacteria bacterium]|nr:protein kinase [Deltaproteobacteria bacterium]
MGELGDLREDRRRDAPDRLPPDTRVAEFRIRGFLGEGATGEVYLAQDLTLGRRVALKLIKPNQLGGDGVARFLEEARVTARFNHPHIVTLHAIGEHAGRAYLALEYLEGDSLRARLAEGPLPTREALRIARAIAEALAEAHHHDVVHADLKPENVIVPRDGRVRVLDFGLARLIGTEVGAASGTPAYMAPERWRNEPPTAAIDIWSLGVVLHELITGARPYVGAQLARLVEGEPVAPPTLVRTATWGPLVEACLALDPRARPAAGEVARALAELIEPSTGDLHQGRGPYPGLAAFGRADAAHYVGRAAELEAVVELLRARPLVPIAGPSGAGKSSFVHAAVVPRVEGDRGWAVIACRPGAAPFTALARALEVRDVDAVAAAIRASPGRLTLELAQLAARRARCVLLVIDQFEEAFTLAPADARTFCECVAAAALADEPWRFVLTIRDDFLGPLASAPAMRPHLGATTVLAPLSLADLEAAVLQPLARFGYLPDERDLARRIAADVADQPACLPLLQFTCQALWDRRDEVAKTIARREYDAMGGAGGALASHAQRLMAQLTPEQVALAREVLLALVNPDGTRRPRSRAELLAERPPSATAVLERLVERRLVVARREAGADDASLELAHEALTTTWPQLARWLDETHEQRAMLSELEQAAVLWQRRGARAEETWTGGTLTEVVRRVAHFRLTLPSAPRAFLDAGIARERRQRRRRRWVAGLAISALGAIAIGATLAAIAYARKEREAVAQQAQIRLAAADMGLFDLELEPFDWDAARQQATPPAAPPHLEWRLHAIDARDPRAPGRLFTDDDLRRGDAAWRRGALVERVEARSGPAFLEIARGPDCGPSWIYLQRLPGFTERNAAAPAKVHVRVPTCAASRADMIAIPAGPFIANVDREDGSGADDTLRVLPAFAIDRTEVTRGAFAIYEAMRALTGDVAAPASYLHLDRPGGERLPIVGVKLDVARRYCQYLGGDLPTTDQWQKTYRGGLVIDGLPNTQPLREEPWVTAAPHPANLAPETGHGDIAPVASFLDDRSPYGVMDLAGNVSEWSLTPALGGELRGLRTLLGGNWDMPASVGFQRVTLRNTRADGYFDFEIGFRCVTQP